MKSAAQSKASWLASQPPEQRESFLKSLTPDELEFLQYDWSFWGRPDQQLPSGNWFVWLILAGRGWGKTRTAVENIARMLRGPTPLSAPAGAPAIMSIIADSPFDMRQYTIEGPSGFLNVGPPEW
ncbi:MAG: ATP-binding protein, partial [Patescibacteria group bacterium]|nr:ATP-binding protein [Patescibacteria group bacterium]